MRWPGSRNWHRSATRSRQNDGRPSTVDRRPKEARMAVEATSSVQAGHGGEPIVRGRLVRGGGGGRAGGGGPIVRDRLFMGGEWVEPSGGGSIDVIDSTTEEVMGSVPEGSSEDVERA